MPNQEVETESSISTAGSIPMKPEALYSRGRYTNSTSHAESRLSVVMAAWEWLMWADGRVSQSLAICASMNSRLGLLYPVMLLLELSCHGIPWIIIPIVWFFSSHLVEQQEVALNLFILVVIDLIVTFTLKAAVARPRPHSNQGDIIASVSADRYSFPSGHATRTAILFFVFTRNVVFTGFKMAIFNTWCGALVISRLLLGRHYPTDILAGCCIGALEHYAYMTWLWLPQPVVIDFIDPFIGHIFL